MTCSECDNPARPFCFTCSTHCVRERSKRLRRERGKADTAARQAERLKHPTQPLQGPHNRSQEPCKWCSEFFYQRLDEKTAHFERRTYCDEACKRARDNAVNQGRMVGDPLPFTPPTPQERKDDLEKMLTEIPEGSPARPLVLRRLAKWAA